MKMKTILLGGAMAMALGLGGALIAQESGAPGTMQQGRPMGGHGMRADTNGDGNLTRAEATAGAEALFTRLDGNGDGRLTPDDREAARDRMAGEVFSRIDADNNGSVTRAEWDAAREQRRANRAEGDDDDDGHGGGRGHGRRGHGRGHHGMMGGHMMDMARAADTNNDGAIDRAEFMAGATARFNDADGNRDGTVTPSEHEAARAAMRAQRQAARAAARSNNGQPATSAQPAQTPTN